MLALLLTVVGIEWQGYAFGGSNQSIQVPVLLASVDASLFANDPIRQSFAGYTTYFFALLAPLVRAGIPVTLLYFVLYALAYWASLLALVRLAEGLGSSTLVGFLAALLHMARVQSLGAEWTTWKQQAGKTCAGKGGSPASNGPSASLRPCLPTASR